MKFGAGILTSGVSEDCFTFKAVSRCKEVRGRV
jgi:hypothetical protein